MLETEPAHITITINGSTVAVQAAILTLARTLGGDNIEAVAVATDGTEAQVTAKRKPRGKAADPAPTLSEATADADILAAASAPLVDTSNVVQDMTATEARNAGIRCVQDFFSAHPDAMPTISKLSDKFGVKFFKDIEDDRAHEFYADAKLVAAGSGDAL